MTKPNPDDRSDNVERLQIWFKTHLEILKKQKRPGNLLRPEDRDWIEAKNERRLKNHCQHGGRN